MSPASKQNLSWDVFSKNILLIPSQSNLKFFFLFHFYAHCIQLIKKREYKRMLNNWELSLVTSVSNNPSDLTNLFCVYYVWYTMIESLTSGAR